MPVHCFHLVFTLPSELHSLAYCNPREIFALLFRSAADTLLTLAADPKWLGYSAQPRRIPAALYSGVAPPLHVIRAAPGHIARKSGSNVISRCGNDALGVRCHSQARCVSGVQVPLRRPHHPSLAV